MSAMIKIKGRCSYPDVFRKRAYQESDPPEKHRYGCHVIFPKADTKQVEIIRQAILTVIKEKHPKDAEKQFKIFEAAQKLPLKDGDLTGREELEGMCDFAAYEKKVRPLVVNRDRSLIVEDDNILYPGCNIVLLAEVYYSDNGGARVTAALKGVQFVSDGEAFSARKPVTPAEFDDLSGV